MSNPPGTIRRDTRVFISAVTREFASVRKLVKKALEDNDYHAVEQDNFPPHYRDLVDKDRERIDTCDAVVHIVGHCYGAEPGQRPQGAPRRSYTQLEYDTAVELGKPVYVFLIGDGFPVEPHEPEPTELRELQEAHRNHLTSIGRDYSPTASIEQLDQKIRSLRIKVQRLEGELQQVDLQVADLSHRSRRRFLLGSIALAALIAIVALVLSRITRDVGKEVGKDITAVGNKLEEVRKQFADPDVLTGKIKSHIRKRAEEEIAAAKARTPDDWRKREEIEKRRDQALERVEDLVETIRKGLAGEPDPIFLEAAEILNKRGVDEAINYLEEKQPSIEKKISAAKSIRDQSEQRLREAYRPKVLQADLYQASLKWVAAFKIREEVARENPQWFEARTLLGELLLELARYGEAEPQLRAALESAANPGEEARGLSDLARLFQETNRLSEAQPLYRQALTIAERVYGPDHPDIATLNNNLAELLRSTNRLAEAEPFYRRALVIDERSLGPSDPNVARDLSNLALMLADTNRRSNAEPLYRRALAIDERSHGPDHPAVAIRLNNLAQLLEATNRMSEAEPLYRQSLAIAERVYGSHHPLVATNLNNLAGLLRSTNRLTEAEPLLRRALAIAERSHGADHPDIANGFSRLAWLLLDTNRMEEAESLMRRALAIDEVSYGPDHPDVARDLNNLAWLLNSTNRQAAAEPLYRRALAIDEVSYGPDHPAVATDLNNLSQLLRNTNRLAAAEPLLRRALAIADRTHGPNHPTVAISLDGLGTLLQATSRLAEAEPLLRQALAIDERSYGPDHQEVAIHIWKLALLLQATDRRSEAEPLMARAVLIFARSERSTGYENPNLATAVVDYRQLLGLQKLGESEIAARIKGAAEGKERPSPIVPEVERLLGPARPIAAVLASLDHQYRVQGKPAVYFLGPGEPIAPHLDELLRPTRDGLAARAGSAFRRGAYADAVVLYDAALALMADQPKGVLVKLRTRANRAAALRDLGLVEPARDELSGLLPELEKLPAPEASVRGRVRYNLALCQWRLGERAAAETSAEQSLAAYRRATTAQQVNPGLQKQSEELLASLKAGKSPPPLAKVDASAVLDEARARCRAREALMKLGLKQPAAPLLDQILGPAKPTKDVLSALDRKYRDQGKPAIWLWPLDKAITPVLDRLLGPAKTVKEVLDALDRQYREQGKPALWFLPLDQPIAPHLDELVGKSSLRSAGAR